MSKKKKFTILAFVIVVPFIFYWIINRGALEIKTTKGPVFVQIDNKNYGETTSTKKYLPPGEYQIEISKDGHITKRYNITITRWQTTTLAPELLRKSQEAEKINNDSALFLASDKNKGNLLYYNKNDGYFYKIKSDSNKKETLSRDPVLGVSDIKWSPSRDKVIITVESGLEEAPDLDKNIETYILTISSGKKIILGKNIVSYAWSPEGEYVVFSISEPNEDYSLYIINSDGSNKKKVSTLDISLSDMNWINEQEILLSNFSYVLSETNLYLLNIKSNDIKPLTTEGGSVGSSVSPDKKIIAYVYRQNENSNGVLAFIDFSKQESQKTEVIAKTIGDILWDEEINSIIHRDEAEEGFTIFSQVDLVTRTESDFFNIEDTVESFCITPDKKFLIFSTKEGLFKVRIR